VSLDRYYYQILPAIKRVQMLVFATIIATEAARRGLFAWPCLAVLNMNPSIDVEEPCLDRIEEQN